jgi:hypothetical protein
LVPKQELLRYFFLVKEGTKDVQLTYNDRNLMNVLTKQVNQRDYEEEKSRVGLLDLIGKDRM